MIKQLSFFYFLLVGAIITTAFSACTPDKQSDLELEVAELRTEVKILRELKDNLELLEDDVRSLKRARQIENTAPDDAPIRTAVFRADDSYKDDPFIGPKDANTIVMAFSDYQCQPCRKFYTSTFPQLRDEFLESNQLKFILRDFPLESNPHSADAAILAHCAGEQGLYWKMHDRLFNEANAVDKGDLLQIASSTVDINADKLRSCFEKQRYADEIRLDMEDAKKLGAKGAPGFFVGKRDRKDTYRGVFIRGAQPYPVIRQEIIKVLAANDNANGDRS